jgi:hypothetical protein
VSAVTSRIVQWTRHVQGSQVLGYEVDRVDVGQTGAEPFVVLADPEGNEICILR